jgi:hypothetical protein
VVLEEVEVGPEVAGDMRSTVGCVWRRRQLLRCSWHCLPDALRTATASGSQSRAQLHSPSACSPQLLIDGCAVNTALCCVKSREAEGFTWRSVARRGKQKRLVVGFDVQSTSMRGRNDAQAHALEIGWVGSG